MANAIEEEIAFDPDGEPYFPERTQKPLLHFFTVEIPDALGRKFYLHIEGHSIKELLDYVQEIQNADQFAVDVSKLPFESVQDTDSRSSRAPAPSPRPQQRPSRGRSGSVMQCGKCGGDTYDNREDKRSPNGADFRCKDSAKCGAGGWIQDDETIRWSYPKR